MYTPEQVYQEIGTAVPFSKWCKSHCIKADESLSETDRVMLIFSSRNTKAKEELAAEIAREKERLALIKTPPELIEGNIFAEGFKTVGNEVVISSRAVAEILGSRHTEVLRSIDREWRALKVILEEEKHKDCSDRCTQGGVHLKILAVTEVFEGFIISTYTDDSGREQREYLLKEGAALQIITKHSTAMRAVLIKLFLEAKRVYTRYLEATTLALGDPTLRPIPRKVYIMWDPDKGHCKIGISKHPDKRLLQGKTFVEHLYLVWESMITTNAAEIEAAIHKHFEDKHVHGEWFAVSPEEAFDYINTLDFGRVLIS